MLFHFEAIYLQPLLAVKNGVFESKYDMQIDKSTRGNSGVFFCWQHWHDASRKRYRKGWTYRREVVSSAGLSSVFAREKHVIQLVAQSVHKLQVGSLKVSGWQKEPEVRQLPEPGPTVLLKQVQNHGPHCPVGQQQAQPVAGKVQVALGELVEADRVVVTDRDRGEGQFFGPLGVDPRVCGEGKPVK